MESSRVVRCCIRRSITPQNTQPHSFPTPSRALRHPHGRRKQFVASPFTRPLSTAPSQLQEENKSSHPPSSQSRTPQASTAPRPSPWAGLTQGQRPPGGVSKTPSTRDPALLQKNLDGLLDVLDFLPKYKAPPQGLTGQIAREIDVNDAKTTHDALAAVHLRLTPMLGRTVPVNTGPGLDLQSAFRQLEIKCAQNNVKGDSMKQRTHVRRGQAKKELRSKRWRALFKEGFLREVGRVRRMKGQGW
jgi:hypothetical protein